MTKIKISVISEDFNVAKEMDRLTDNRTDIGALVSFTGFVRDFHNGKTIKKLTLEHFPVMAEKQLRKIAEKAAKHWPLNAITVIHRFGALYPSDQIVLVLTASAHRGAAFSAAEYMMDWLKTDAPFWKKEETDQGSHWVESKASDEDQKNKWTENN